MAIKFSTKLRNMLSSGEISRHVATLTNTTIASVDGGPNNDTFTDSNNGFLTAGFFANDLIMVYGFTGAMIHTHGPFKIISVDAGTIEVATGSLSTNIAGDSVTIVCLVGGSIRDIFKKGVLKIYSGSQPSSPDDSLGASTLLCSVSVSSGVFTPGTVTNGLELGAASGGIISKSTQVWSGLVSETGTAAWFRLMANSLDASGEDTLYVYPRIDGAISTSGSDMNMGSVSLSSGSTVTVDTFAITFLESAA